MFCPIEEGVTMTGIFLQVLHLALYFLYCHNYYCTCLHLDDSPIETLLRRKNVIIAAKCNTDTKCNTTAKCNNIDAKRNKESTQNVTTL